MDYTEETSVFTAAIIGTFFLVFSISGFLVWLVFFFQKKVYTNLYKEEINHQKELIKISIDSQEKERERVAYELHDEISSVLAAAKMQISFLPEIWDNKNLIQSTILESKKLLDISLNKINNLSQKLSPVFLTSFGLEDSLKTFFETIQDLIQVKLFYQISEKIPHEHKLALYKIILELAHDTLLYAQAYHISIHIRTENNRIILEYMDDGLGWSYQERAKGTSFKKVESRVCAFEGDIRILDIYRNFHLEITLPISI